MFHLIALSVSKIIWGFWQISKWLWCIGRVILATDNWSTQIILFQCHSTTINTRQTGMNPGLWTERLVPDYLSTFIILCFDYSYGFNKAPQILPETRQFPTENKNRHFAYPWLNCFLSITWECVGAIMHYTLIVIRHSETGDLACVIFIKIVFFPWWRTDKLHCIFTVFTEPHNNTILYAVIVESLSCCVTSKDGAQMWSA